MSIKKGEMLSKAILIATLAHAGQFDKGGKPYILHPLTVLHKVGADDEEVQCAAVLHDVIEDCTGKTIYIGGVAKVISFAMLLEEGMSEQVVDTVRRLTKMPGQTYEEYQEGVLGSVKAMLVKKEDLRTNSDLRRLKSRAITEKDIARVAKYMQFYALIEGKLAGQ
jgi:GTP diphosphokinase / guanosine-3',5'-bis(diphosphate) 3'-diphosphatase